MKLTSAFIVLLFVSATSVAQTDSITGRTSILVDSAMTVISRPRLESQAYQLNDNGICRHRLVKNTGALIGAGLLTFGVLMLLPEETTLWDKEDLKWSSMTEEWHDNVTSGPVWDDDDFFFNWITHPYCGAVFYMGARGAGYKILPSFLYSATMSTFFWEYGIEAFAEVPSIQDLVITPTVGSLLGEGFFSAKKSIKRNGDRLLGKKWLGITAMWLMDPLNQLVDLLEGPRCKNVFTASAMYLPSGGTGIYNVSFKLNFGRGYKTRSLSF